MKKTKEMNNKKTKNGLNPTLHITHPTSQKGITLIALVITIIVMLILVGVTISMAVNGGLFNYAGKAVGDTNNAILAEQQLANGGITIGDKYYNSIDEYLAVTGGGNGGNNITYKYMDTYTQGDYIYTFLRVNREEYREYYENLVNMPLEDALSTMQVTEEQFWEMTNIPETGYTNAEWDVRVADNSKTSYGEILSEVEGFPVTSMDGTFLNCTNLIVAPEIPSSVKIMNNTFKGCTSLTSAPSIPSNVIHLRQAFTGCTSLTGEIVINTNKITTSENGNGYNSNTCYACFSGVDMANITLTGSAPKEVLNLIGSTGNNYTPIP